jgi:hypothetical protein
MSGHTLAVALEGLRDFGSIRRFRLKSSIFLTLKGNISGPERIAGKRAAVDLVVVNARTSHDPEEHQREGKIASHEHLFCLDANRVCRADVSEVSKTCKERLNKDDLDNWLSIVEHAPPVFRSYADGLMEGASGDIWETMRKV